MITSLITALTAFVSTNIDDIFILMIFFAQEETKRGKRYIVIGQYLGIGILTGMSLVGAFAAKLIPQSCLGLLGLVPIAFGIKEWIAYRREEDSPDQEMEVLGSEILVPIRKGIANVIRPEILRVTCVTIANGADNIGVYVPLFAGFSIGQIAIVAAVFAVMTALWCFLGEKLAELPALKAGIAKYKHIIVPVVFILLGMYILMKNYVF